MAPTTDAFDVLCQQVFMTAQDTSSQATATPSIQETALAVLAQAQPYELPSSYVLPPSAIECAGSETKERTFYRIHLENIDDPGLQQSVRNALVLAIDPGTLIVVPFDRNLSGYSSKTRTESKKAPLDQAVLLDMADVSSEAESSCFSSESQQAAYSTAYSQGATPVDDAQVDSKTMLLVPTTSWIRKTGRIRFWRAESHRVKAAQREVVLDELLNERWKLHSATNTVSSPPPSSGSLLAAIIPPTSLPSSPISSSSSSSSSPATSPRPTTARGTAVPLTRSSSLKQPFQEHQLESLVQFMKCYGDEPSVASILRGLLDLIRRQLTQPTVLSWTFDRANLTEQKPEATVAFLDLIARLGLELQIMNMDQKQRVPSSALLTPASSDSTINASSTGIDSSSSGTSSTELTWTFGTKADDRRLEYLIHHIQQTNLPVLKMDSQSLLPSTASFIANESTQSGVTHSSSQNPMPTATRKRFLQGQSTIPAGIIQNLTTTTNITGPSTEPGTSVAAVTVTREQAFVLSSSKYALTADAFGSLTPAVFVHRVKRDVKDLARWASTCGGRLDWIWAWLFSSFQKSRHGSSSAAAARKPRPNDENV